MPIGTTTNKRLLPERANLEFWYPDGNTVLFMPFFENPKIIESATANYVEYSPLARAGSLFVYTGAKSRKLRLEVSYTIPELMNYQMGISAYKRIFDGTSKSDKKKAFYKHLQESGPTAPLLTGTSIAQEARKFFVSFDPLLDDGTPQAIAAPEIVEQITNELDSAAELDKTVDTLLFFIAILRSSILNNAEDPLQGPPIARLNFGTLYQSVPCIVKKYNMKWDEKSGYDLGTLTPRRVTFSIELNEVRVGDFGVFERSDLIKRDNLAGWESVINSPHTTNPGRGVEESNA